MALIALKADYIYKANSIYKKLQDFEDVFEIEANIINYAKCVIVHDEPLTDFGVMGVYVSVYETSKGYDLYYLDYIMNLNVYDRQIIDFSISRN